MDLIYFLVSVVVFYSLHSVFALETVKDKLQKKIIPKRYYRISYNILSLGLLALVFLIYRSMEKQLVFELNQWIKLMGLILFGTGILIAILAMKQYNLREFTGIYYLKKRNQPKIELNTKGLNSYVRHPLYTASLIIFWSWFLIFPNTAMFSFAFLSTVYLYFGIRLEERKLILEYGATYKEYKKKVPMLFPFGKKKSGLSL